MKSEKKWFNGLQSLRGLLFIIVFISHSRAFIGNYGQLGAMGVCGFFILSGFLSSYHYLTSKESSICVGESTIKLLLKNVWSQLKKFYPLYFVFLLISAYFRPSTVINFLKCVFLTQSYWLDTNVALSYNWPTWFLSSIMLSYFFAPLINKFLYRIKKIWILVLIGIICLSLIMLWSYIWSWDTSDNGVGYYYTYIFPVARIIDFSLGSICGCVFVVREKNDYEKKRIYTEDLFEIFIILILIICQSICKYLPLVYTYTAIWVLPSLGLVWIFANEQGVVSRFFAKQKVMLWLGTISFELYISHRMILLYYSDNERNIASFLFAIITTIIVSEGFYLIRKKYILLNKKNK